MDDIVNVQKKNVNEIIHALERLDSVNEQALKQKTKAIEEKQQAIEEKDQIIEEKQQTIEEKQQAIEEKDQIIEEKEKILQEKTQECLEFKKKCLFLEEQLLNSKQITYEEEENQAILKNLQWNTKGVWKFIPLLVIPIYFLIKKM
ncbi:unnamed protein product [Rotaria socialis]|uniref:Uncharacterized protein n=1 Tax=Rotaria socialis TaxID=392032 RepID=A0A817KND1_9BILA|nr:unnamed protein product [Rotaria socialis]CAF3299371.1 unnamed protein product [Rotaria socialis]CAF3360028.1 unnamed protein product [Rotaria socialis]CAF3496603.1 unnamed protein product [Rotaria socialis]CAF4501511.1 unnamed protein product [Rotaria socialis]